MPEQKKQYTHPSTYFNSEEDKQFLEELKEEAKKNNMNFSDYFKQLARLGRNTQLYKLPDVVTQTDQSPRIKALEEELEKLRSDTVRLTELKTSGFDWNKILRVLDSSSYKTEFTILEETGNIGKSLSDDEYDQDFLDMQIAELQANLFIRKDYYKDVEYKMNQGWKLCSK
jgi:O-methyltransferase involved in polyketide biosynthesis